MKRPFPRLLREVRMSTPSVTADTLALAAEAGLQVARRGARLIEMLVNSHPSRSGRSKVSSKLRGSLLAAWFIFEVTIRYSVGWKTHF
jgi:hypothetical protein